MQRSPDRVSARSEPQQWKSGPSHHRALSFKPCFSHMHSGNVGWSQSRGAPRPAGRQWWAFGQSWGVQRDTGLGPVVPVPPRLSLTHWVLCLSQIFHLSARVCSPVPGQVLLKESKLVKHLIKYTFYVNHHTECSFGDGTLDFPTHPGLHSSVLCTFPRIKPNAPQIPKRTGSYLPASVSRAPSALGLCHALSHLRAFAHAFPSTRYPLSPLPSLGHYPYPSHLSRVASSSGKSPLISLDKLRPCAPRNSGFL